MEQGKELAGRVALVTGASRNIGRAIALALAGAGAAIVVNTRQARAAAESVVKEIEAAGGKALSMVADVTDEAAVAAMVDHAVKGFGRLDIVVNNAAIRPAQKIEETTLTKAFARELAPLGITANCVVPGLVDTARGPVPSAHAALPSLLGRLGRADEIAAMVRYLSGPAARFITGQAIHVNGGAYMP